MKRIASTIVIITTLVLFAGNIFAQGVSQASAIFLMISPGARAGGMGETNVALANDAYATYWNPAGLGSIKGKQFSGMHANWLPQLDLPDLFYDFASYVQNFEGIGTVGFSATYLNMGEQEHRDEHNNFMGTFSSYEMAIGLSYGVQLTENFAVGSTLKYVYSRLTPYSTGEQPGKGTGSSVAVDIGLLWMPGFFKKTTIGINLQNLGPKITYIDASQADPIPTNLKLGFAYRALTGEFNNLTFSVDFNKMLVTKYTDGTSDPFYKALFTSWTKGGFNQQIKNANLGGGAEYWYANTFSLRAGYFYEDIGKRRFATFGAGIRMSIYQFDFGYITGEEGNPLTDTMRFSLSFIF